MLYGLDVGVEKSIIVVGDSKGKMYFVDSRSEEKIFEGQLHKKGMKVRALTGCLLCDSLADTCQEQDFSSLINISHKGELWAVLCFGTKSVDNALRHCHSAP